MNDQGGHSEGAAGGPAQSPSRPGGRATLDPTLARATGPRAFLGLLQRDIWNTLRHELGGFLAQSLMQPLAFLFVFGLVLPKIGAANASYATQLLPGIIALTLVLTALQNVSLPLVIEFSYTKEIEDRLLAPISPLMVGVEKLVFATGRSMIAALLILPLGELILPNGLQTAGAHWGMFIVLLIVGGFAGASIGLVLGTMVPANRINIIFAVALTPLIFTGATFYPWQLLDSLRWFQVVTLFNPLTYVSEGMRAALTDSPHLGAGWIALGLAVSTSVFLVLGLRGFIHRAVD